MLCESYLSLRDEKEKQEGSTLARPTDQDCFAKPPVYGVCKILKDGAVERF